MYHNLISSAGQVVDAKLTLTVHLRCSLHRYAVIGHGNGCRGDACAHGVLYFSLQRAARILPFQGTSKAQKHEQDKPGGYTGSGAD